LRILATTDFHGNAEAFRKTVSKAKETRADIIVVCGDVTHFGPLTQAKELLSLLAKASCSILFVPGNCDPPTLAEENIEGAKSIHGKCKQVGDVCFLGLGGSSPSPFDTPFELSEAKIANILEEGFKNCQERCNLVLVSHPPPKDTKVDVAFTGEHVGSFSVREFIEKRKPKLVICGHIHEAVGIDKINDVLMVNPGPARHRQCALIDLNKNIKIKLDNL